MISNQSADSSYVNVHELPGNTDAVGDANVMVTQDGHWYVDVTATNGVGDTGAVHTYATVSGLIIFNGFDTDAMGTTEDSGVDWLSKLWYSNSNSNGIPTGYPIRTPSPARRPSGPQAP